MEKHFIKGLFLDALFGLCLALCIATVAVLTSQVVKANNTVSDNVVVSDNSAVSSNDIVSGDNVVSGDFVTFEQGDTIIGYLKLIIFIMLFSFCFERVRNGIALFNKTR